jgi:hypothetical protein
MNAPGPTAPSEPLARLEARVRWLTALCSFLTLGLVALAAWQFAPRPKVVEANAFVLRDAQWHRRGELALREDGSPMLRLNNAAGRERLMMFARERGEVVIRLSDSEDVYRARLALEEGGQPRLLLAGPDGQTRASLAPVGGAYSGLALYGEDHKAIWTAP